MIPCSASRYPQGAAAANRETRTRDALGLFVASATVLLMGCANVATAAGTADQGPPFRTTNDAATDRMMLAGQDAVAHFSQNEVLPRQPRHPGRTPVRDLALCPRGEPGRVPERAHEVHAGRRLLEQRLSYAVSLGAGVGPNTWRFHRGKLYEFRGQASRDQFEMGRCPSPLGRSRLRPLWFLLLTTKFQRARRPIARIFSRSGHMRTPLANCAGRLVGLHRCNGQATPCNAAQGDRLPLQTVEHIARKRPLPQQPPTSETRGTIIHSHARFVTQRKIAV